MGRGEIQNENLTSAAIFGFGYSAREWARRFRAGGEGLAATFRRAEDGRAARDEFPALEPLLFDSAEAAASLARRQALIASIPAGPQGDPALARWRAATAASPARKIVYLSTLGVYADSGGRWIDETAPTGARETRLDHRLAAEAQWLELGRETGKAVFVLRLAGIYGPGRNAFVNLRAGRARRLIKPGQVFNRIHVADVAGAVEACLRADSAGGIFNVADDEPAPPQDVIEYAARKAGLPVPPDIAFSEADLTAAAASFWSSCKRVANARLKRETGWRPLYPTFREGLDALAPESRAGAPVKGI